MFCELNGSVPVFCACVQDKKAKGAFLRSYQPLAKAKAMTNTVFAEKRRVLSVWVWLHSTSASGHTSAAVCMTAAEGSGPCGSSPRTTYVLTYIASTLDLVCSIQLDTSPWSQLFSWWYYLTRYLYTTLAEYSEISTVIFITVSPKFKKSREIITVHH